MQKRYQVFVSSTFKDLEEERKEVMKALLELRCIPAGMEMFPAANDEQWKLIQRVIDDSDYYVVIIGGRYGSVDAAGMSYTEKEYRYAVKKGIPVYGFVHENPGKIAGEKLETDTKARKRLEAFRKLVQSKHVKYWKTASELGGVVSRAISIAKEDEPRLGWVRGDRILTEEHIQEALELQKQVRLLQAKLDESLEPPVGIENLAQGEDAIVLNLVGWTSEYERRYNKEGNIVRLKVTWNDLFEAVAPLLASRSSKSGWKSALEKKLLDLHEGACKVQNAQISARNQAAEDARRASRKPQGSSRSEAVDDEDDVADAYSWIYEEKYEPQMTILVIPEEELAKVILQFRALGLIKLRPGGTGFMITQYGDRIALRLAAITREAPTGT